MSGQTAGNLPAACGVEAATLTGNAQKRVWEDSTRLAAIVKLAEGENPQPSNYRGCSNAKAEIRRRKIQRAPKPNTGRVFSSKYITPGVSFTEDLQRKADQTQKSHPRQAADAAPATVDHPRVQTPPKWQQAGQSVPAQIVNSLPLDNMIRVVTVVQQFMAEFNDAVSKEAKIHAISKLVLTLTEQNGQ
jgi:hypothetical protein